jgi:2-amino-4-hydroxy-6-hydroxymethyldihydropteridine diphosphokinase
VYKMASIPAVVHVGIGSNLGDARANCLKALEALDGLRQSRLIRASSLYRTEPVGYEDQEWFVNCAAMLETRLSPHDLMLAMQEMERAAGRKRLTPLGPRTLDLDLLFYGDLIVQENGLTVPHPELIRRRFVLEPLREIDPGKIHPVLNKTVEELYLALQDSKQVWKMP